MHIGEIGGEEVLVATDDSGHVIIHFPTTQFTRPPLIFKVPASAWGQDTHSQKRLVAISCNAHIITIFHLGMGIEGWEWTQPKQGTQVLHHHYHHPQSIELGGHVNNIPCVAFSCEGEYIASGSLDNSIRIWKCQNGQCIKKFVTNYP